MSLMSWLILAFLLNEHAAAEPFNHKAGLDRIRTLELRARVLELKPEVPVYIRWGFGEGTEVNAGSLCRVKPDKPDLNQAAAVDLGTGDLDGEDEDDLLGEKKPQDRVIVDDGTYLEHYLKVGAWSPPLPIEKMLPGERYRHKITGLYTFALIPLEGSAQSLKDVVMEFEILHNGKSIKRIRQDGKHGATIAISLRGLIYLFYGREVTNPDFSGNCLSLVDYVKKQKKWIDDLPWGKRSLPNKFPFTTICIGHSKGIGYGIKHTSLKVTAAEYEIVQALGISGLRGGTHLQEWISVYGRPPLTIIGKSTGYALPEPDRFTSNPLKRYAPGSGCPLYPANLAEARKNASFAVQRMLKQRGVREVWGITEDEIGSAFKGPDRTAHVFSCDYCIEGYRNWIKGMGLKPDDFGRKAWAEIDPWDPRKGPRPIPWHMRTANALEEKAEQKAEQQKKLLDNLGSLSAVGEEKPEEAELDAAIGSIDQPDESAVSKEPEQKQVAVNEAETDFGRHMMNYYLSRFYYEASAMMFEPLRQGCDAANRAKREAIEAGKSESPAARQPYVYSYALRMQHVYGGAIYNFYRHADNGFMFETSSHDPRTHIFDSLFCDVGRVISRKLNKRFGILIKPVRGSTLQRGMTFIGREGRMIYWYNYGPKYGGKISSIFSHKNFLKERVGRFSRIVARAEDVVYNAEWAYPAEVAIVWPLTTAVHDRRGPALGDSMGIWLALTHAHIPVDPLDEGFLLSEDLSQYKVIYISGAGLRRDVSQRLAEWVRGGGTLYSGGGSMRYDEGRRPLDAIRNLMGLQERMPLQAGEGVSVKGGGEFGSFELISQYEPLKPSKGAEILATFEDGSPALIRNRHGRGQAITCAFMPGREYRVPLNKPNEDGSMNMEDTVDDSRGAYITAHLQSHVAPVVDTGKACVEGNLLRHPESGKLAVTLTNWAYHQPDAKTRLSEIEWKNLELTIRTAKPIKRVVSAWLDKDVPSKFGNGKVVVTLPFLKDMDILLLE